MSNSPPMTAQEREQMQVGIARRAEEWLRAAKGRYPDPAQMLQEAADMTGNNEGVFLELNPVASGSMVPSSDAGNIQRYLKLKKFLDAHPLDGSVKKVEPAAKTSALQASLTARAAELKSEEEQLSKQKQAQEETAAALAKREKEMAEHEIAVQERVLELDARAAALKAEEERLGREKQALGAVADLAAREENVTAREVAVKAKEAQLIARAAALTAEEERLGRQKETQDSAAAALEARQTAVAVLEIAVQEREAQLNARAAALTAEEERLSRQKETQDSAAAALEARQTAVAVLEIAVQEREAQLNARADAVNIPEDRLSQAQQLHAEAPAVLVDARNVAAAEESSGQGEIPAAPVQTETDVAAPAAAVPTPITEPDDRAAAPQEEREELAAAPTPASKRPQEPVMNGLPASPRVGPRAAIKKRARVQPREQPKVTADELIARAESPNAPFTDAGSRRQGSFFLLTWNGIASALFAIAKGADFDPSQTIRNYTAAEVLPSFFAQAKLDKDALYQALKEKLPNFRTPPTEWEVLYKSLATGIPINVSKYSVGNAQGITGEELFAIGQICKERCPGLQLPNERASAQGRA